MSDRTMCRWCQGRYDAALAHDLHATDTERARLHADLLKVCNPRFCPPVTDAIGSAT